MSDQIFIEQTDKIMNLLRSVAPLVRRLICRLVGHNWAIGEQLGDEGYILYCARCNATCIVPAGAIGWMQIKDGLLHVRLK